MHNADICLAGTLCLVTMGNRNLADFQGVAIDKCGFARPFWTDDSGSGALTVAGRQTGGNSVYNVNPCPPTNIPESPLTAGLVVISALLIVLCLPRIRRRRDIKPA